MDLGDLQPKTDWTTFAACFKQIFCSFHSDALNPCIGKNPWSSLHWNFAAPGQARHRRKDLIVKWIWLLHAFCQPWGLKKETSNGRIGTHPPLPTTACTPRADIFTRVGAISNHTSTRPGCFDRKPHVKQQKPLSEKRKKAFHGPHTEYLLCNTHTPSPTTDPIRLDWEVPRCSSLSAMHMQQFWTL